MEIVSASRIPLRPMQAECLRDRLAEFVCEEGHASVMLAESLRKEVKMTSLRVQRQFLHNAAIREDLAHWLVPTLKVSAVAIQAKVVLDGVSL